MELEDLNSMETNSCVMLCMKCLENDEYYIPLFELNEYDEIIYKCSKKHTIDKKDISYRILNDKLKYLLTRCQEKNHSREFIEQGNNIVCAWCEKCEKNICQLEVSNDLKLGHDYTLYMKIMPDKNFVSYIKESIDKLKILIDNYNKLCPNEKEDINFLIKTYNRKYMNYNLYNNENIINYQTINNLLFNSYDGFNNDLLQYFENNLIKKRYIFLYKEILDIKDTTKIKKTEINFKLKGKNNFTPLIQDDNGLEAYLCLESLEDIFPKNRLTVYNKIGNIINSIESYGRHEILPYNNDLIILYDRHDFILVYFTGDYQNHSLKQIFLKLDYQMEYLNIDWNYKLIKTSSDNFIFLICGIAFLIPLKEHLQYNSNDKSIKLIPKKLNSNINRIICINSAYYKNNNNILEGVVSASVSLIDYTLKDKCKIKLLNENLEIISEIEFNYPFEEKSIKNKIKTYDINYNHLNNMILLFIDKEIYQIDINTKQVITIYDISSLIPKNITFLFHYNENINKLEQIIILITKENDKNKDNIYLINWSEKNLLFKKKYALNDIKNIIPLYTLHMLKDIDNKDISNIDQKKKFNEQLLFIESNNLITFNNA